MAPWACTRSMVCAKHSERAKVQLHTNIVSFLNKELHATRSEKIAPTESSSQLIGR